MELFYDGYGLGAGSGGPIQVPVDTRVIIGAGQPRGYGDYGPSVPGGPIALGPAPFLRRVARGPYGGFGAIEEEAAAAWGASATQPTVWTGVGVGITVWLLTKVLDRIFFD